jgi:DNA gyrase subunit B
MATDGNIEILRGLEQIRRRPGMYVGYCDSRGIAHILEELLAGFLEQVRAGRSTWVEVELLPAEGYRVIANGAWLDTGPFGNEGRTFVEVAFTEVGPRHAGLAFPTANALSQDLHVEIHRDGLFWRQAFSYGRPCAPLQPVGPSDRAELQITFWPDPTIFKDGRDVPPNPLANRLRDLAALHPGTQIRFVNRRNSPARTNAFHLPSGLVDYVRLLNRDAAPLHRDVVTVREAGPPGVEVALQWTAGSNRLLAFANAHPVGRGTHVEGFRRGLTLACKQHLNAVGLWKPGCRPLTWEECSAGLTAAVAVELEWTEFSGKTRDNLLNPEAVAAIQGPVRRALDTFFRDHPAESRAVAARILAACDARRQGRRTSPRP